MKRRIKKLEKVRWPRWATGAVVVVLAIIAFFFVADRPLALALLEWLYLMDVGEIQIWSEVLRNFGLVAAAIAAGGLAVWRSKINQRQAHTAEQGQITDRYSEAVRMLSEDNARTRTGAVYALARIAQDSIEHDHIPVMEVLAEFIRNPPYQNEADARATLRSQVREVMATHDPNAILEPTAPPAVQCPDIHAALNVIADRSDAQKAREQTAGFRPHFFQAALRDLNLHSATFPHANLSFAELSGADLTFATLPHAILAHTMLDEADLTAADLTDADLTSAYLGGADLTDANLARADLGGARLNGVHLINANLTDADFTDAYLDHAYLYGATGLTQGQINVCLPSPPPNDLPEYLDWPFVMEAHGGWARKT